MNTGLRRGHALPVARFRQSLLAAAAMLLVAGGSPPAFADGGRGGDGALHSAAGGAAGTAESPNGQAGGAADASGSGASGAGGGGGGPGGGAGGAGSPGIVDPGVSGGGDGGAGGAGGLNGNGGGDFTTGTVTGGAGDAGSAGSNGSTNGGGGGGGGAGGYGAAVTSVDTSDTYGASFTAGDGGTGGMGGGGNDSGRGYGGYGGGGGDGGVGLLYSGVALTNGGTATGGVGGTGGEGGYGGGGGDYSTGGGGGGGGDGGSGGVGLSFSGTALTSNGEVAGGRGGGGGPGGAWGVYSGKGGRGGDGGIGLLFSGTALTNNAAVTGGDGNFGGRASTVNPSSAVSSGADGGVGGSGGIGLSFSGMALTNNAAITGGRGGIGGLSSGGILGGGNGGDGGSGGAGVSFSGATLTNNAAIRGGDGNEGGPGGYGGFGANGGNGGGGGNGGVGLSFSGTVLMNSAAITGGNGGAGNIGGSGGGAGGMNGSHGDAGAGGVGVLVSGDGATVINAGSIAGGHSAGTPIQADALRFSGTGNRLELRSGYSFTGNVVAQQAGNTLVLGGDASPASSFDVSKMVAAPGAGATDEYVGFSGLGKTGGSTWTLTGIGTYTGGTAIGGGTLSVGSDANLGAVSGGLTFNGGTLQASSAFDTNRAIALAGAGTIQADTGALPLVLGGPISGPGGLTLTGAGNVALSHASTYQGGTNVYTNVHVSATGALGTGAVTVRGDVSGGVAAAWLAFVNDAGAGGLSIHTTARASLGFDDTAHADQATLRNDAYGATYFVGHASAGQAHIVNGSWGWTNFGGSASAGQAQFINQAQGYTGFAQQTDAGSASFVNQSQGMTIFTDQASAGSATVSNEAGGALLMGSSSTAGGATVINAAGGVVDISQTSTGTSIGSLSGAGDVGLGGKVLTLGALNRNDTISGAIVDAALTDGLLISVPPVAPGKGSLVKVGSGTLTLNGVNTYTGGTTVDAGALAVGDADHSSASVAGDVQVNTGGTLRGHGSIAGNVNSTGMVWPGGSIGTLTIGGNYTQSPSGTLQMEISPAAASQLKVGGTASLAGTLSLLYAPGTYTTKAYTLVSAGSVNGTFSTVTSNAPAGVTQALGYGAKALDLNLTAAARPVQPTQPPQPAQPVVVAPTQATIFGAVGGSALRAGQGANEVLLDRLAGPCGVMAAVASMRTAVADSQGSGASSRASAAGGSASAAGASGSSAAGTSRSAAQSLSCARQGNGLWIQAQGTDTRIDGNNGAPDARDRRYGFLTSVDHQWKGMTVGVAGGYSHADVSKSGNGSKGTLDTLRLAGYAAKNLGAYTLAGTLGYAYDFSSTTRSFGALGATKGDGHGQEFTAGLQASRPWSLGPVVLTPRVGVRYAYLDGLSTNESGPTAQNLGVGSQHLQSLQPYVGVTLDYPFTLRDNDRPASIQVRAGYAYETQSTGRDVSVTSADGTGFVIAGTRDTRGLVTAGLGATLPIGKSASAYVRYDSVLHTGNVNVQSLQAGLDYRF